MKILFFILISSLVLGQNRQVDSLKEELNKSDNIDLKIKNYEKIIVAYWVESPQLAEKYTEEMRLFSESKNYAKGILLSKIFSATNADIRGDIDEAKIMFEELEKEIPENETYLWASYYYNYANHKLYLENFSEALELYESAIKYYTSLNNEKTIARIKLNMGYILAKQNKFYQSIKLYEESIPILEKHKDWLGLSAVYGRIGYNFGVLSEHQKALEYHQKGLEIDRKHKFLGNEAYALANIASEYGDLEQYGLSKDYYLEALSKFKQLNDDNMIVKCELNIVSNYFKQNEFNKGFLLLNKIDFSKNNSINNEINYHHLMGNYFSKTKNFIESETHLKKAYELYENNNESGRINVVYDLLNSHLINLKAFQAIKYLKEYDSLSKDKNSFDNKIAFFHLEEKYKSLEKDNHIKSQQIALEEEKFNRKIAIIGIVVIIILFIISIRLMKFRQKQKELQNEKELLRLQQNLGEMELQNLNKQLNPHEIKNLLASISSEIQDKAPESYRKMIKLFNLIKVSLNNNSITDSIKNQINQIENFLSLEKSMLSVPLSYSIENYIGDDQIQIPKLILKNFVENAIKHGIKTKENGGAIVVKLLQDNKFIHIIVDDTGKGRESSEAMGIGISTYQKLFLILNKKNKNQASLAIIDKEPGMKIHVKIPLDYQYE